jgi:hypothetical protein
MMGFQGRIQESSEVLLRRREIRSVAREVVRGKGDRSVVGDQAETAAVSFGRMVTSISSLKVSG